MFKKYNLQRFTEAIQFTKIYWSNIIYKVLLKQYNLQRFTEDIRFERFTEAIQFANNNKTLWKDSALDCYLYNILS